MSSEETIRTTLYYREGTSDKVYEVTLEPKGKGYVVNVAYGRRGGTMKKDLKTPKPLPAYEAGQIHAGLVRDKVAKGYKGADAYGEDGEEEKEATWDHPKLGRFEHDGVAWTRTVKTPGFKPFRYDGSSTKCELGFETKDESEQPSPAAIAVAERVLANQAALVTKVAKALWDDFTGKGPDSGMYWHGDLDSLADGMEFEETLKPPKKPADVPRLMQLTNITIQKPRRGQDKPLAELSFAAAFEDEHGVGILTDGRTILGIGYSSDVSPFKKSKRKR
jgi:hypothetical protein